MGSWVSSPLQTYAQGPGEVTQAMPPHSSFPGHPLPIFSMAGISLCFVSFYHPPNFLMSFKQMLPGIQTKPRHLGAAFIHGRKKTSSMKWEKIRGTHVPKIPEPSLPGLVRSHVPWGCLFLPSLAVKTWLQVKSGLDKLLAAVVVSCNGGAGRAPCGDCALAGTRRDVNPGSRAGPWAFSEQWLLPFTLK